MPSKKPLPSSRRGRAARARLPENVKEILLHIAKERSPVLANLRKGRFPTAEGRSILRYGRTFIETFKRHPIGKTNLLLCMVTEKHESSIGIAILGNIRENAFGQFRLGVLKLGFQENTVIVEAIQGPWLQKEAMERVNRALGTPWPNYLLAQIESHARTCGFARVKIRKPETHYFYQKPAWGFNPKKTRGVQWNMRRLYTRAALAMGYKEEKEFFVKDL